MSAKPWSCNHPWPEGFAEHGAGLSSTSSGSVALSDIFWGQGRVASERGLPDIRGCQIQGKMPSFSLPAVALFVQHLAA